MLDFTNGRLELQAYFTNNCSVIKPNTGKELQGGEGEGGGANAEK